MEEARADIEKAGATIIAISPQDVQHTKATVEDLGLGYHVLSDKGNRLARKVGLVYAFDEDAKEAYRSLGTDLAEYNGDESWTLPIPALFIVGRDSVVRHTYADSNYTVRPEPSEVIERLRELA